MANRFYKLATIEPIGDNYQILLDGRKLSTPKRKALLLPTEKTAQIIADEWNSQPTELDPNLMPITRLLNVAIDNAAEKRDAMVAEICKYASTDLLCYWVSSPAPIVAKQNELWQPVLDWTKTKHGMDFKIVTDSFDVAQNDDALNKFALIANDLDDIYLTILTFMTQVLGSAILALALTDGIINAENTFKAIRIEEDHNATIWGYDDEDLQKSSLKNADIKAIEGLLLALK